MKLNYWDKMAGELDVREMSVGARHAYDDGLVLAVYKTEELVDDENGDCDCEYVYYIEDIDHRIAGPFCKDEIDVRMCEYTIGEFSSQDKDAMFFFWNTSCDLDDLPYDKRFYTFKQIEELSEEYADEINPNIMLAQMLVLDYLVVYDEDEIPDSYKK